ncbi:MAG: lantibiotic dehydratase [Kofleriaceae bacterium]|nr:lantibiotic dehydratase [Kofleriaceae bacterium]MBP6840957.1 lantibiotic dehydratase [Kofleriaceae bacterium]
MSGASAGDRGRRARAYQAIGRFVFRTPLLPIDSLAQWSARGRDVAEARAALSQLLSDPVIAEALFVASPELAGQLDEWRAQPESPAGVGIERALVRYLARMATRSTPFGLFSGVSVGQLGETTRIELPARSANLRHTRLDGDYLFGVCRDLEPVVRAELRYWPNTSLYPAAGRLRYAEARVQGGSRSYHLVAVDPTDYLSAVLARAEAGATVAELTDVLCQDPDISRDEATEFVAELIAAQLVVPELQPPVTGVEPTHAMIQQLAALPAGQPAAAALAAAQALVEELDRAPIGTRPDVYRQVAAQVGQGLPGKVALARLFQVDMHKPPAVATLGPAVVDQLLDGVELLRRLSPGGEDDPLARFRQAFSTRYETREVPLLEVLDEEVGIGLGDAAATGGAAAPMIADLAFPPRAGGAPAAARSGGGRDGVLLGLLDRALSTGARVIELDDDDLKRLGARTVPRPADAASVSAVLLAESAEAIAEGRYLMRLQGVDGGAAARLLGRFCHGSPEVTALVADILRAEEAHRPDAIYAEIVHLPEGRIGNILLRPVLRDFEIVYLGASGAPVDHQLGASDLMVSVVGDRVILRSRRLDREVVPRLTSAHNYSARSLGVYRFLCSLAAQDGRGLGWSWGALEAAPFLPRLQRGRLVLARARWVLRSTELDPLEEASKGSSAAKTVAQIRALRAREAAAVAALRQLRQLPRWVVVADGDNELAVDLDDALAVDSFIHLVKGRSSVVLHELLPEPGPTWVRSAEGSFAHELIVPLTRVATAPEPTRAPVRRAASTAAIVRRFPPGSDWLYAKLYTGTASADVLLREAVGPLVHEVMAEGLADRWFFIRYGDPDWHLRVRFHGEPARLAGEVLPRLHARLAPLIDSGACWRVQLDTYEREVERYGGPVGIDLAERWFHADSEAVLAIVEASSGDEGADAAWRLAVRAIDRLYADLGYDLPGRLRLTTRGRDGFAAEFGVDTTFQKRLGEKFRAHKDELAALLAAADDDADHPFAPGLVAIAARTTSGAPVLAALHAAAARGELTGSVDDLVGSYVHMHVNRLLSASQRQQELVLYDLLRRHYDGVLARERHASRGR